MIKSILKYLAVAAVATSVSITAAHAETLPKSIRFGEVGGTNVASSGGKPTSVGNVALATYLGFFEEEFGKNGPSIDQVFFAGTGPAQNEALAQGEIDFGTYGGVPNVIGLASRIPAYIVETRRASATGNYYLGVKPESGIRSVPDLKGKRIAVQKGTNPYQVLIQLLEAKGLKESDVTIASLQGGEAVVAFNAGAIDAVFGGVNLLILRDQGKVTILKDAAEFVPPVSQSGVLVSAKFEKQYPETLARVVKVFAKTAWWASQEANRETLLKFVSERSLGYKYVKEQYAGSLKDRYNPVIDASTYAAYEDTSKFAFDHKLIRKEIDKKTVKSWFKPEYQQAALKALKLENYWAPDSVATAGTPKGN